MVGRRIPRDRHRATARGPARDPHRLRRAAALVGDPGGRHRRHRAGLGRGGRRRPAPRVDGRPRQHRGRRRPALPAVPRRPPRGSVVYADTTILKVLRMGEPGPNPDVEITRVLAERGYEHVLPPIAELRRDDMDLAVLRDFLVGATEGWQLARASVRDLLASRLPPEECGADFAPDAARLGDVIAGLHVAMADAWGREPGDVARWMGQMSV